MVISFYFRIFAVLNSKIMVYYVIDKDNKVFYRGEDKEVAIEKFKNEPTSLFILYQLQEDGETYILRENYFK